MGDFPAAHMSLAFVCVSVYVCVYSTHTHTVDLCLCVLKWLYCFFKTLVPSWCTLSPHNEMKGKQGL